MAPSGFFWGGRFGGTPVTSQLLGLPPARPKTSGIIHETEPIPYHTIPYHTIPYHTIPYHTIPYHTISRLNIGTELVGEGTSAMTSEGHQE